MNRSQELQKAHQALRARIDQAAHDSKRDPKEIKLIWVSKTRPLEDVQAAASIGAEHFGENRVQEALDKFSQAIPHTQLHIIGPVQSNKLRKAAGVAQWIHSVDSMDTVLKLDRIAGELQTKLRVLFQVNTSEEASKSGLEMRDIALFLKELPHCSHLIYSGLMTIGPNSGRPEDAREGFQFLRETLERFCGTEELFADFRELSMGMSDDLEIAIAEGATMIRVGSALFGARDYSQPKH